MKSKAVVTVIDGAEFTRITLDMNYREWAELPLSKTVDFMTREEKAAVIRMLRVLERAVERGEV